MKIIKMILIICLFFSNYAFAAGVKEMPVVYKNANWVVRCESDTMTDKMTCVGLYKDNINIQLNKDTLYIVMSGRGGVDGYILRFDDAQPEEMTLATDKDKEIGCVRIGGSDFQRLLSSKRLRVRVLTILRSLVDEDINLNGICEAHDVIQQKESK
jgi:hypothetical protein